MRRLLVTSLLILAACPRAVPPPTGAGPAPSTGAAALARPEPEEGALPAAPASGPGAPSRVGEARLLAVARLPAATFAPGPASGALVAPRQAGSPWPTQPVQGFSGLLAQPDGGFLTLTDNGYGAPETSSDFLLRVYALRVDLDGGAISPTAVFTLSDPDRRIPWPIAHAFTPGRVLTGADLDPESFARAPDGTFWFGDEHGPFLLHTDAAGRVLEAPYELPAFGLADAGVLRGPDNPFLRENLTLRSLEALRAHAKANGAKDPWLSPDHALLRDEAQVAQLQRAGFRVVPWTANEPGRLAELAAFKVDGVISDRPDLARTAFPAADVQGHRGARGLRPENTLPAFEAALDLGVTTLELDLTATRDGMLVWHDAAFSSEKCRATKPGAPGSLVGGTASVLAAAWICDGLLSKYPEQQNDRALSPVAVAFAADRGLKDAYTPVTLGQVLDFVRAYEAHYAGGEGGTHPEAARRVETARRVRLNVETKVHPEGAGRDQAAWLTERVGTLLGSPQWKGRVTLQSFDWRSLRAAHVRSPWLQTVALLNATSMAAPDEARGGLPWPEAPREPLAVARSGGFENLALSADGTHLVALLEKPLAGAAARDLVAFRFELATRQWTGVAFRFPLDARAVAVGDIAFIDARTGYALERDDTEGRVDGYKRLVRFTLPATPGGLVSRADAADLVRLPAADGAPFAFSFWTIEGVAVLPGGRVAIVNDNNFPFGRARSASLPDGTELLLVAPAL